MITITNRELLEARTALVAIGEKTMHVKPAYRIAVLKRKVNPYLEALQETQTKLLEQYGKRDEKGELVQTRDDKGVTTQLADAATYSAAFSALMTDCVQLDAEPLPLDWLETSAGLEVQPDWLYQLGPLLSNGATP